MSSTREWTNVDNELWDEVLRCPSCAMESSVSLAQRAGEDTPTVLSEPLGFNVVATEYGPAFYCKRCDKPAEP